MVLVLRHSIENCSKVTVLIRETEIVFNVAVVSRPFFSDAEDDVRKQVFPHFLRGLLALESFVQVLENTPNDVSTKAAQRMMSDLLGFVITSHEAFCLATTTIHQINDRLDNNLQTVVVEEKSMNDSLIQTRQIKFSKTGREGERITRLVR